MSTVLLQKDVRGYQEFWKSNNFPTSPSLQEQKKLFQELEKNPENKELRKEIIERNIRLVRSRVGEIKNSRSTPGLEFEDLYDEGSIGLMKAVDKFDWKKGYRFSTYAFSWINQEITRAIDNQSRIIRVPVHSTKMLVEYRKAKEKLYQELRRSPSVQEIAEELKIKKEKVNFLEKIKDDTISLDKPLSGDEENNPLIDFTEDKKINSPSVEAEAEDIREKLKEILSSLDPREKKILMMRFGLEDGKYCILQEVGDVLGITKERVRQIQKNALRKLKRDPRTILLK